MARHTDDPLLHAVSELAERASQQGRLALHVALLLILRGSRLSTEQQDRLAQAGQLILSVVEDRKR